MAINVPIATIQIARRIGKQVIANFKAQDEVLWSVEHTTGQTTPETLQAGFDLVHDYRAMPRYVLLYFDGKDANDVSPEAIVAAHVFNLSDNIESEVYKHTAWRTFPLFRNVPLSSNLSAVELSQRETVMYNRAENREQRAVAHMSIKERGYKRMVQFIFNDNGTVSRII